MRMLEGGKTTREGGIEHRDYCGVRATGGSTTHLSSLICMSMVSCTYSDLGNIWSKEQ